MKRFTFNRLHKPTGERSTGEIDAQSLEGALLQLNDWNRQSALNQQYKWFYWMDTPQLTGRVV